MQKRNEETFADIPGVRIIADDMIISAKDETEHDAIVRKVMQILYFHPMRNSNK